MVHSASLASLSPAIVVHLVLAVAAARCSARSR